METPETEAITKKKRATNKRLQRSYGISIERREQLIAQQHGQCKICGRELAELTTPPQVDHFHFHVEAYRTPLGWHAVTVLDTDQVITADAPTKAAAIRIAKLLALPRSVRGILCFQCNRGLGYAERFFRHDPSVIHSAAKYLEDRQFSS